MLVRDGDVWLATPDGAFERRLTVTGGYDAPSMDDNGTIVALRGGSFVRLRGDGGVIGAPMRAVGGDWIVARGPFDARVSPDGIRIAYWFTGRRRFCLPLQPGCSVQDSEITAYAYAERVTDPLELGSVRDYREPSWLGSGRAVMFRHVTGTGETVATNRVGGGEAERQGWFSYDDGTQLGQGQVSRGGDKFAALAGTGAIHLFGMASPPPALPVLRCIVRGGPFTSPTWSPDGSMLAWAESDGVHVAGPVPDLRAPVPDCGVIRERRLAAGSDPFWGPADVPGAPAAGPRPPAGKPAGRRPGRAYRSLRVARRQRGRAVRLRLRIVRAPARVDARLTLGGRARRAHGRAPRPQGHAATAGAAQPPRPARARAPGTAGAAPPRGGQRARAGARHRAPSRDVAACQGVLTAASEAGPERDRSRTARAPGADFLRRRPTSDDPRSGRSHTSIRCTRTTNFPIVGGEGRTAGSTEPFPEVGMTKSRMAVLGAVAAFALLSSGGPVQPLLRPRARRSRRWSR